jgi:hypothetical protein
LKRANASIGCVVGTGVVVVESNKPSGCVVVPRRIPEKRRCTNARISVCGVAIERSGAESRVMAGGGVALERIPTDGRIV